MTFRTIRWARQFAASIAIIGVLLAPETQWAHAAAMAAPGVADCAHQAMARGGAMPGPQHSQHRHDAHCCDFCSIGCGVVALPGAPAAAMPQLIAAAEERVPVAPRWAPRSDPHLLPYWLAPPTPLV